MDRVIDNDLRLLRLGPSERAVAHRLAVYLEQEFPAWSTDCEYNRQGNVGDRKQAVLNPNEAAKDVDPDIIIHQRGPDGPNLLAIEVKPADCKEKDAKHDIRKLQAYLEEPHAHPRHIRTSQTRGSSPGCSLSHRRRSIGAAPPQ